MNTTNINPEVISKINDAYIALVQAATEAISNDDVITYFKIAEMRNAAHDLWLDLTTEEVEA